MEKSIGDRIKDLREQANLTQTDVARKIGVSKQTLYKYENGIIDNIPIEKIESLANLFDVSPSIIMGWNANIEDIPNIIPLHKVRRIPILGEIACGEPILAIENFDGYFMADPTIINADFALRAEGDSMIDANIYSGDLVFIKQVSEVENGAIVAILIEDTTTLKRFYRTDSQIILQPENKDYQPIIISSDMASSIKIIGEMIGVYSARSK